MTKNNHVLDLINTIDSLNDLHNNQSGNIVIGHEAGNDIKEGQTNQIRIGNGASTKGEDMVIFDHGRVVITKEVFEFILGKEFAEKIYEKFNS